MTIKKDKRAKKWTISYLRNKIVWPVFSKYIRLRDADWHGYTTCVTCGKVGLYKTMQAGHFIPGRMNSILFDERGVHAQCYLCNGPLKGNPRRYNDFMKKKYGQAVINELDRLSLKPREFTYDELIDLWNLFKQKVEDLLSNRHTKLI